MGSNFDVGESFKKIQQFPVFRQPHRARRHSKQDKQWEC